MTTTWNDRQKRMVTNWMKQTYDQFTQRIMHTREGKIKDIDKVARGRIFIAKHAHELGMVDQLGGLQDAIKFAASEVDLTDYEIKSIPASKSLLDLFSGNIDPEVEARLPWKPQITIKHDSPLMLMPASLRKALMQQLQMVQLLDKRPVMLVSPYVITIK
jgi:protease-4